MPKIKCNKKYFIISLLFTFLFLSTGIFNIQSTDLIVNNNSGIVYAKGSHSSGHSFGTSASHISSSKSSGGSFKSGSFSSPKSTFHKSSNGNSSSGNFKSGSFSNTPNSSSKSSSNKSSSSTSQSNGNYNNESRRSFFPIPLPIPWGYSNGYYGGGSLLASFFWGFAKLVILVLIIIFIINRINKFKRKR
ncbi:hypothetical protein [Clostridium luticellarii]|uniref:Uncharacterized protein n=1 Tax=Clostridium luticellarii TaxID=1691940 RepID=A0A2T0B426_9CLOT|nr:hypothetical protein [Clostridium luticellarii]MCI1944901.1 hypothetical protein [Clostridium luticellarii]MCI1968423.1 hypothetical protein [Clostridium luticellarii]MCI1995421.1 hypothetical protein [Clostridium luticellarii]MCI2039484.1 hypothetical protein [Clostridium luticellarii]PRR78573.1 hypothetical protein CLLU_36390 [Clostridium luticellarii]